MSKRKNKGRLSNAGGFAGIPRIVMRSADYVGLSYSAKALLFELAYLYKGTNNGNLSASYSDLIKRGFGSKNTISKNLKELTNANLILKTRDGRFLNPGGVCALYALTWLNIDECTRHDHPPTRTPIRKFSLEQKPLKSQ